MRVYFDACCLNRPFDDQRQIRIRLETEAIAHLLRAVDEGRLVWVTSDALLYELLRCPDTDRRSALLAMCSSASERVLVDAILMKRAREIRSQRVRDLDALHLACAEQGRAAVVLTTDDKFTAAAARLNPSSVVRVVNPVVLETELLQ